MKEIEKRMNEKGKKFDLQERFTTLIHELLYHAHSQAPAWECYKRMKFPLQSWGFVTSKKKALIQRKRKRSDSDQNTWILDIPCWILDNQIFYF